MSTNKFHTSIFDQAILQLIVNQYVTEFCFQKDRYMSQMFEFNGFDQ